MVQKMAKQCSLCKTITFSFLYSIFTLHYLLMASRNYGHLVKNSYNLKVIDSSLRIDQTLKVDDQEKCIFQKCKSSQIFASLSFLDKQLNGLHCNLHNLNGKIYSTLTKSLLYPNKVRNYRRHEKLLRRAKIRSSNAAVTMSKTLASLECKTRCTICFKNDAKMFGSRQHTRLKHIKDKNTQFQI